MVVFAEINKMTASENIEDMPYKTRILFCQHCKHWFTHMGGNIIPKSCPVCKKPYRINRCTRCGTVWRNRSTSLAKVCMSCKSPYWAVRRQRTHKRWHND